MDDRLLSNEEQQRGMRLLFCLPSTQISGGLKVIFQLVNQLKANGESVDVFSFAGFPKWFPLKANLIEAKDFESIDMSAYDFVLVSNAFMVPMVLPLLQNARCIRLQWTAPDAFRI